jgi:hypothetical protein
LKTTPFHARFVRIADLVILEEDAFILINATAQPNKPLRFGA